MGNKVINTTSVKLGIYEESTDEQLEGMLGDVKEMEDGRKFRLCSNGTGAALAAGLRVQSVAVDGLDDKLVVNTLAAAGQKDIIVDVTTSHGGHDAHALRDGYLVVNQGAGEIGGFYKIKDNTVMVADSTATISLYDDLTEALPVTDDEVTICKNPYKAVLLDVLTAPIAGVPLINVTISTSTTTYYFWALFEGFGPAIASAATIAAGDELERLTGGTVRTLAAGETVQFIGVSYSEAAESDAIICKYA